MENAIDQPQKQYAFYSARWHRHQKWAIIQIICTDGRMLRLFVVDATKKWCKFYSNVIKAYKPVSEEISRNTREWTRLSATCTAETMQGVIDRWQGAQESDKTNQTQQEPV